MSEADVRGLGGNAARREEKGETPPGRRWDSLQLTPAYLRVARAADDITQDRPGAG